MVEPSKRTRSVKKKKLRTPGGKRVTHYKAEKASKICCGKCKKPLSGVTTGSATEMKNTAKTKKVPSKPYAGVLCPKCLDSLMRYVTRMEAKFSQKELEDLDILRDLRIEKYLPRGWFDEVSKGKIKKKAKRSVPKRGAKKAKKAEVKAKPAAKPKAAAEPKAKSPKGAKPKAKAKTKSKK